MFKRVTFFLLLSSSLPLFSQYRWDVGIRLGTSNYLGDIGGEIEDRKDFVYDLKLAETRWAMSGFARYKLNSLLSFQGALTYLRVTGSDKFSTNPGRMGRNLSFRNDIVDLSAYTQIFFYEINDLGRTYRYRNDFRAYGYTGLTGFYHSPKADYNGEWVALRPLKTEGQLKPYSPVGFAIPFGLGFYFTIEKRYRIGWELSWRKTFTDYSDDISTTYAKLDDPTAAAVANRTLELDRSSDETIPQKENYFPGNKRGDPTHNDAYMFTTLNLSYTFRGKSAFYKSKYGSIFKGTKYRKRRVRAKF